MFKIQVNKSSKPILITIIDLSKNKHITDITSFTSMSISRKNNIFVSSTNHNSQHFLHILHHEKNQIEYRFIWDFVPTYSITNNLAYITDTDQDGRKREIGLDSEIINAYDSENNQYNLYMWKSDDRMERKIISALEHKGGSGEFSNCDDGGTSSVDLNGWVYLLKRE